MPRPASENLHLSCRSEIDDLLRRSFQIADVQLSVVETTNCVGRVAMLDALSEEISRRVSALERGQTFSLRTLFGGREEFGKVGTSGQRKALGTQFRRSVEAGDFDEIEYSHHNQSPAEHWYRRV